MHAVSVLRERVARSVHLEADTAGRPVVVKRFHDPRALGPLVDGLRAWREHAALARLHAAGLPVPRPLGVTRVGRTFELRQEAVSGARALGEFLVGDGTPPRGWRALLAALGALLARLQTLGLEHGDLHPGNVLVDARGGPWLIDLARLGRGARTAARRQGELELATALGREFLDAETRLAFLAGYRRALAPDARPRLDHAARLALEEAGRARRRALVELGLNRWLRDSSRVARAPDGSFTRRTARADPAPANALELRGSPANLRTAWLAAARLHEHRLPTVVPLRLEPTRALFERPLRGAPDEETYQALRADRSLAPDPHPARDARGVYFVPTA